MLSQERLPPPLLQYIRTRRRQLQQPCTNVCIVFISNIYSLQAEHESRISKKIQNASCMLYIMMVGVGRIHL